MPCGEEEDERSEDGDEERTGDGGEVSSARREEAVRDRQGRLPCGRSPVGSRTATASAQCCPRPAAHTRTARGLPQSPTELARGGAAPRGLCPTGQQHPFPRRPRGPAKAATHRPVSRLGDRPRAGASGQGCHRSRSSAARIEDGGVSWRRAPHRAGETGINGNNWAGRRRGTSPPRGCRGPGSQQLGLSV
ncbi:uncharacterized protein C10orf95-like [Delphinapterus leucas]|uniref:Uncharacterized protein C10orf95-like n=1 Tax=Delphinapterus leucas TaxID=9749 RepID=A0A2Y9LQA8_DELLE|nr:uncharacterized protein C10orf95-like [Delphinapterus leucas]